MEEKLLSIKNKLINNNTNKEEKEELIQEFNFLLNNQIEIFNKKGINENEKQKNYQKIFNDNFRNNFVEIFKYIIENYIRKVDVDILNNLFLRACEVGEIKFVQNLFLLQDLCFEKDQGNNLIQKTYLDTYDDFYKCNSFAFACMNGHIDIVKLLYSKYGNKVMDSIAEDESIGTRAFYHACNTGQIEVVKYLFEIPDINIDINFLKENKLFLSVFIHSGMEMAKLLYEKYKNEDGIININETDKNGKAAIHYACFYKNIEPIEFLLSIPNIDINISDIFRETPFVASCNIRRYDIARMLYNRPDFDKERNDFNKINKVNLVEFINNKQIYTHKSRIITYFIGDKSFTATLCANSNIKFNFEGLEGITSEQFEKEMNKILNSFENVNSFDTYISWLPLALIEFKKQERQKNQNRVIDDEIEFFYVYHGMNKIKEIINNNLKNKENKILVYDFNFSSEELEDGGHSGHAIPLVIFNSKDINGNPQTKILAFNTGFKSEKAFEKFEKKLGNDVEIIKIDKDLLQKYGSCNISPKPMIEALFSSFMNELGEGESLVDKLEQYSQDMIMANKLAELKEESNIINEIKNKLFNAIHILTGMFKTTKNYINELSNVNNVNLEDKNTINLKNINNMKETIDEKKIETKEEILKNINLKKYLKRLQKYKVINERLTENYEMLYSNPAKNSLNSILPLNKNLDKAIKYVDEAIKKIEMEKDFKNNPMEYLF